MEPTTLLVVKLEAQQWNIVLAGMNELPIKTGLAVFQMVMQQLQAQEPSTNGLDTHPPMTSYEVSSHDPV